MPGSGSRNYALEVALGAGALVAVSVFTLKLLTRRKKKITRIIDTIEVFKKGSVHMKDPDLVEEMVSQLIKGGAARLQVVTDFDSTLSRSHINGVKCPSTYGILESGPYASEENKYQANLLYEYYHPIEIDPHLSIEEKLPYMKEWYAKSHKLIVNSGVKKDNIEEMVSLCRVLLRDGCDEMFHLLYTHDVPLLIFSAGIGDILKEVLRQQELLYPNVKIIANFMQFNEEQKLMGFKGDVIHTFNKNRSSVDNREYFEHIKARHNVILLGDSLGDVDMTEGIKDANCILKIGFLNNKIDENLPKFLKAYDIVLADDQTMDIPNEILKQIL